jgi:glycosyltransferase involved in cell wall biosynthesis
VNPLSWHEQGSDQPGAPATGRASQPLRVAHVTWGLDVGGMEKVLVELARHADRERLALHFVSLGTRGVLAPEIERFGWPVTALGAPPGLRPDLVARLVSLFRRGRFEVVHTHNTKALVYGGPAARLARVPLLVHTWHGHNLLASPREGLLFRLASRLADRVVAVSRDAAGHLAREGIVDSKLRTIPNGIDLERFSPAGPQPGGPVVTVARLSPEKDVATLVRAAALVREKCPDFRLEIAGEGACLAELRALANHLDLAGQVRFLGRVEDVPALLGRASLFVLPSLTEGISLTLLEAMARGLPVVATQVGGNPEVVAEGETGLLVPPGRPEELASAILHLLASPELSRRMGEAGRRRVRERFDVRGMAAAYDALYREGLRDKSVSPTQAAPPRPRVVSNLPGLSRPPASAQLRNDSLPVGRCPFLAGLRAWLASFAADAVVIDQEHRLLEVLCALRGLVPLPGPPLVSVDLVLSRPTPTLTGRLKAALKSWLLRQVDLFLVHMKDTRAWQECYGIPARKMRYVPFKVNQLKETRRSEVREDPYVFTGGKSRRDYRTFCEAMALTGYPGLIVTPRAEDGTEHGTALDGFDAPPNVAVLHDDGSFDSWAAKMAAARLVVLCISPETICPSGVSVYLLAMALGKCVIISDCPATRGILVPDETAILVPMGDPLALAEAIRKAWSDDAYRRHVAEGGRRYALGLGGEETLMGNVAREIRTLV